MEFARRRQTITTWSECFPDFNNVSTVVRRQRLVFYCTGGVSAISLLASGLSVAAEMNPLCSMILAIGCLFVGVPFHVVSRILLTPRFITPFLWITLISVIFVRPAWIAAAGSASAGLTIIVEAVEHPQHFLVDEEWRIGIVLMSSFSGLVMQCAFIAAAMDNSEKLVKIATLGAASSLVSFGTAVSIGLDIQGALEEQASRMICKKLVWITLTAFNLLNLTFTWAKEANSNLPNHQYGINAKLDHMLETKQGELLNDLQHESDNQVLNLNYDSNEDTDQSKESDSSSVFIPNPLAPKSVKDAANAVIRLDPTKSIRGGKDIKSEISEVDNENNSTKAQRIEEHTDTGNSTETAVKPVFSGLRSRVKQILSGPKDDEIDEDIVEEEVEAVAPDNSTTFVHKIKKRPSKSTTVKTTTKKISEHEEEPSKNATFLQAASLVQGDLGSNPPSPPSDSSFVTLHKRALHTSAGDLDRRRKHTRTRRRHKKRRRNRRNLASFIASDQDCPGNHPVHQKKVTHPVSFIELRKDDPANSGTIIEDDDNSALDDNADMLSPNFASNDDRMSDTAEENFEEEEPHRGIDGGADAIDEDDIFAS